MIAYEYGACRLYHGLTGNYSGPESRLVGSSRRQSTGCGLTGRWDSVGAGTTELRETVACAETVAADFPQRERPYWGCPWPNFVSRVEGKYLAYIGKYLAY